MIERFTGVALVTGTILSVAAGPAAANDWAGPYIGIGGGYAMSNTSVNTFPTDFPGIINTPKSGQAGTGGFLTLSAGYDHALFGPLVVGAFVDYDFADTDTHTSSILLSHLGHIKLGDQLSVGGRVGYLVSPTTLFFSTFGYAHSNPSDMTMNFGGGDRYRASIGSLNGYFLGNGVETMLGSGFSLKAEYRYTSMQAEDAVLGGDESLTNRIKPQIQTIRLGLNYRFGDGKKEVVDNSIPPITSSWTGPYLGFGTGYSVAHKQEDFGAEAGPFNNPVSMDGGFISASIGYDYQFRQRFVVGAFADADLSNLKYSDSNSVEDFDVWSSRGEFKDILMIGGRLGYLTSPDTLLFVSGGYANAGLGASHLTFSLEDPPISAVLYDSTRLSGAFVGAGIETKIWDSVSIKAEYRYIDLESKGLELFPGTDGPVARIAPDIQTGRLSINWRP